MSEHIVSVRVYLTIFLILMVGTILTVFAAKAAFPGPLNAIVAMTIAVFKATAVVLYFMHVRYSSRLIWLVIGSAFFWLVLLFALTFSDYSTRAWLPVLGS
jgi:cytochrome c oxidase subunit 4